MGKEVNISYLRIFDCVAYVHIDSAMRNKLDVKSVKYTLIGYGGDEFRYRFFVEHNQKITRSTRIDQAYEILTEMVTELLS